MEENKKKDVIDLRVLFKRLKEKKRLFIKALSIAFILSCLWIFPQPRYYVTTITLAPETDMLSSGGSLSSLAASFGFNLGNMTSTDAIYPTLYPDVMEASNFIVDLFDIKVVNEDGDIKTDYYTYLTKNQKVSIWQMPLVWLGKQIRGLFPRKEGVLKADGNNGNSDILVLSEEQDKVVSMIQEKITCAVDKKTNVITITVKDQDRLVSAMMADSVRVRLQDFITDYRTRKARVDLEYYTKLTNEAKSDYDKARRQYASYADANTDLMLTSFKAKEQDLENDMQLKYNTYTTLTTQLQMAKAKVQERTPAFTVIQGASVPQRPAGPKRVLFVLAMMFLTFMGTTVCVFKGFIKKQLTALK